MTEGENSKTSFKEANLGFLEPKPLQDERDLHEMTQDPHLCSHQGGGDGSNLGQGVVAAGNL